jgi:hypothetical protein
MRIVLVSTITGLLCAMWLYVMMTPRPTLLSIGVYGTLFVTTGFVGNSACDRIRRSERSDGWAEL